MPASSPNEFDVALIALSARALARSAKRAGLKALAIDLFADVDTREHATKAVRVAAGRRSTFNRKALLATIERNAPAGLPVVFGAGFEDAPRLMAEIGRRNPIAGTAPEVVARLKDPEAFAALLADLGVPHPETRAVAPDGPGWLSKRAGASGGAHIRDGGARGSRHYAQARVSGHAISALFLADGRLAKIVGLSEQWTDPSPGAPYRYGGALGPIEVAAQLRSAIADALTRIVATTGLLGLASADLILRDDAPGFWLLEINPRPGATLDVFDRGETPSLLGLHLDASSGRLPVAVPTPRTAQAAAVIYAPKRLSAASLRRPVWTADWPTCDETLPTGAPVCTVLAAGASPAAARALLEERRSALLQSLTLASAAARAKQPVCP